MFTVLFIILLIPFFTIGNSVPIYATDFLPSGVTVTTTIAIAENYVSKQFSNPGRQTYHVPDPQADVTRIWVSEGTFIQTPVTLYFDVNGITYHATVANNIRTFVNFPSPTEVTNVKVMIQGRVDSTSGLAIGYDYANPPMASSPGSAVLQGPPGTTVSSGQASDESHVWVLKNSGQQIRSFPNPTGYVDKIFTTVTTYVNDVKLYYDIDGITYYQPVGPNSNLVIDLPAPASVSNVKIGIAGRGFSDDAIHVSYILVPENQGPQGEQGPPGPQGPPGIVEQPDATAAFNKIAFVKSTGPNEQIWTMNSDGSGQTNISNSATRDAAPAWSPDGSKIAFMSGNFGSSSEIYVMNFDGSDRTQLTSGAIDSHPSWSPDGTKIAFDSTLSGDYEIYVMNADGTGLTRLTNSPGQDLDPSWSPDGSQIVFTSYRNGNGEIYVMNFDGTKQKNLTNDSRNNITPSWSPDGTKIAYLTGVGDYEISVMNSDGSGQILIPGNGYGPDWSPDGSKIIFHSNRFGGHEILVMNSDGSGVTNISNDAARFDINPHWYKVPVFTAKIADLDRRVSTLETQTTDNTNRITILETLVNNLSGVLATIQASISSILATLAEPTLDTNLLPVDPQANKRDQWFIVVSNGGVLTDATSFSVKLDSNSIGSHTLVSGTDYTITKQSTGIYKLVITKGVIPTINEVQILQVTTTLNSKTVVSFGTVDDGK